jgi:hypothetical protein
VKLIPTLFLLLALATLLYTTIGQAGGICMNIDEAKSEATDRLRSTQLSTLTLTESDFQKGNAAYINSKEIRYHGSLYDIASGTTIGGKTILHVLHDEKEESLLANLKEVVDSWLSTPKNTRQPTGKQLIILKDYIRADRFAMTVHTTMQRVLSAAYSCTVAAPALSVPDSPPKFV